MVFKLGCNAFHELDAFLSKVTSKTGRTYEYHSKINRYPYKLLQALGFCIFIPLVRYDNTPSEPLPQIMIIDRMHGRLSNQWTILGKTDEMLLLQWNGPISHLENVFITAQEARELSDKAHQTAEDLQAVLQKVYEAAEAGNYTLTMTECPEVIQKRLVDLGFKFTDLIISWE